MYYQLSRQSICSICSVCNRSVSNKCIVSNVSSDVSIVTNVSIVGNVSIVVTVKNVKKKSQSESFSLTWLHCEVQRKWQNEQQTSGFVAKSRTEFYFMLLQLATLKFVA